MRDTLCLSHAPYSALRMLAINQKDHVLLVPAQFGLRYKAKSMCRVGALYRYNEFGLGPFEVGVMLLTHPERLKVEPTKKVVLRIDCPGVLYSSKSKQRQPYSVSFSYRTDKYYMELGSRKINQPDAYYGSATGFITATADGVN